MSLSMKALYSYEQHFLYSNKLVGFALGISPNINSTKRFLLFSLIFIWSLPQFIQTLYQFFKTNIDLELTIRLLQRIFISLSLTCIYCFIYLYVEERTVVFEHVKEDYKLVSDNEELVIMEKYSKQSKYYTLLMIVFANLYIILMTFPSILKVILYHLGIYDNILLTLPLSVNVAFDVGLIYYCLLIYQIIVIYIASTVIILSLSWLLVIIQHSSSQLSIIMMKIRRPIIRDHDNLELKLYHECYWMIDIIRRYKRATDLVDLLNDLNKMITLITEFFLMLQIILNFVGLLQLSVDLKNISDNIDLIFFIVASMFTVFIYFHVGQKLLDHCNQVFEELCQVPFYLLSVKTQKLFLVLITRSMKPSYLSIGGLFVATHQVYAALLQKSFSFATVFYSIRS